jgi:hypothetical protein
MSNPSTHMPTPIHYLSIRQPYAWAIISGIKDVENRDWSTNIRGRIYIHAGSNMSELEWGLEDLKKHRVSPLPGEDELTFGAIIGSVEIVDCLERSRSLWHAPRKWGFVLANPIPLPRPIPLKANAKMQRVPEDVLRKLKRQRLTAPF